MFTRLLSAICLVAPLLAATSADAGKASLVRIEPRPYYGAVVTIEQGVRVWRALPRTQHMVINPTGAPVNVNITDIRETITHRSYGEGSSHAGSAYAPPLSGGYQSGGYYLPGYAPSRYHRFNADGRRRAAGLPVRPFAHAGKVVHGGKLYRGHRMAFGGGKKRH